MDFNKVIIMGYVTTLGSVRVERKYRDSRGKLVADYVDVAVQPPEGAIMPAEGTAVLIDGRLEYQADGKTMVVKGERLLSHPVGA